MSMDFTREVVIPAALSAVFEQIFSFVIDNIPRPWSAGTRDDVHLQRLELLLGSLGSAVEEAEGRYITNLHLLAQLKALNDAMYRGRFALEVNELVKNAAIIGDDDDTVDNYVVTTTRKRKFALCSPLNAANRGRLRSLIRGGCNGDGAMMEKRVAAAVEELEALTRDCIRDFILLVQGYPRRNNVPRAVTTTLYMDRRVFGRHVEKERVVAFLLQPAQTTGLSALAVVGAGGVGKTTLVKHVCDDERVRDHFARVEWFSYSDVMVAGAGFREYFHGVRRILDEPRIRAMGRSLLVFDAALTFADEESSWAPLPVYDEESAWAALLATTKLAEGSKLIFTCCDADLARIIGTEDPVVLRHLHEEEYWYYFKAFAFAGEDPRDHPRIAAVGRNICHHLQRTFLETRVLAPLLRVNFNIRFWCRVLAAIDRSDKLPDRINDMVQKLLRISVWSYCTGFSRTQTRPELTMQDALSPSGPFSSSSGTSCLGGDTEEYVTIHLYRESLYMDHRWYHITFKKGHARPLHVGT